MIWRIAFAVIWQSGVGAAGGAAPQCSAAAGNRAVNPAGLLDQHRMMITI
jgi:hypothetical protein